MTRLLTILVMALVLWLACPGAVPKAHAGIEDKLNQQFDAMVNYTPPSFHMGARRGVISGGSLTIRTPNVPVRPFSLVGPSISIGCGGIDAHFGGFSFISKEQLVQAMRSIVTAALTYAFQIALEVMCPTCADILKTVQGWLNQVNEFLTNSCEATRNFMDDSGVSNSIRETVRRFRSDSGAAEDNYAATAQGDARSDVSQGKAESGGRVLQELPAEGNQVWQIFKKSAEASFGFSADDFLEEMMSMTGTIIACVPGDPTDEAANKSCAAAGDYNGSKIGQEGDIAIWKKPALLTLSTIVEGGYRDSKQYQCDDSEKCAKVSINTNPMEGMAQKIRAAFLGSEWTGRPTADAGIIDKMTTYSMIGDGPTPDEIKWMNVGGAFTAMLMRLAVHDRDAAKGFVRDNAEAIAAEIVVAYLDQWLLSARVAAGRTETKGLKESVRLIEEASGNAHNEAKKYYEMSQQRSQLYRTYAARIDPRVTN